MSHRYKGLTLLELLIAVTLTSFMLGAIWLIYSSGFKGFYSQEARSRIKAEAGRALVNLSRELRQASSVTSAQAQVLSFTLDSDDNGLDETLQYSWSGLSGDPLQRVSDYTLNAVNSPNALSFSYYDSGNNLLSEPVSASQVRLVAIDFTVSDKDETFRMRSKVRLRNL